MYYWVLYRLAILMITLSHNIGSSTCLTSPYHRQAATLNMVLRDKGLVHHTNRHGPGAQSIAYIHTHGFVNALRLGCLWYALPGLFVWRLTDNKLALIVYPYTASPTLFRCEYYITFTNWSLPLHTPPGRCWSKLRPSTIQFSLQRTQHWF